LKNQPSKNMGKTTWADMTDEALVLEHQYLQRLIQTCSDDLDEMLRKHPHNSAYRSPQYRKKTQSNIDTLQSPRGWTTTCIACGKSMSRRVNFPAPWGAGSIKIK
jgi:hypothetical protein